MYLSTSQENLKVCVGDPKLLVIHLRYFPPALILEYLDAYEKRKEKTIDLLDLTYGTNTAKICTELLNSEPLFSIPKHGVKLLESLEKLKEKAFHDYTKKYLSLHVIKPHSLPLMDACISKDGHRCATSSLGNGCKIWCTDTGEEIATLIGHTNSVGSIVFDPTGEKILTSSHDGTIRHWTCSEEGFVACKQVLIACEKEKECGRVLFAKYGPDYQLAISATDENAAYVHDLVNGALMYKFTPSITQGQEITSVNLDKTGTLLLVSPHDYNQAAIWDLRSGELIVSLEDHEMEITKSIFDFTSQIIATSSMDSQVKLWDIRRMERPMKTFCECESEVYDIEFDARGSILVGGTADGKLLLWDVLDSKCRFERQAHKSPISKVGISSNGAVVLTCSDHGTVRLYHSEMGTCLQTLPDHNREIVNASFNYSSEYLLTASKDKTVRIHKHTTI